MPIFDQALPVQDVEGDYVQTKFVPLSALEKHLDLVLWDRNAKKHDLSQIYESIWRYGFVDYPKWDTNLNNGEGGVVIGNGRLKSVIQALIDARDDGKEPPKGIPVAKDTGEWCVPIGFGVDADSEAQAEALGIDHNNLTVAASAIDTGLLWDEQGYLQLLTSISDAGFTPVTVDENDIAALLVGGDEGETQEESAGDDPHADSYEEKFGILIECSDAAHQESVYNEIIGLGYKCRVLTV